MVEGVGVAGKEENDASSRKESFKVFSWFTREIRCHKKMTKAVSADPINAHSKWRVIFPTFDTPLGLISLTNGSAGKFVFTPTTRLFAFLIPFFVSCWSTTASRHVLLLFGCCHNKINHWIHFYLQIIHTSLSTINKINISFTYQKTCLAITRNWYFDRFDAHCLGAP